MHHIQRFEIINVKKMDNIKKVSLTLTGIRRLQNPHYNKNARILWMLVLITISSFCLYHVGTMVRRYMKGPVITLLTQEEHEYVQFPYITVCSPSAYNLLNSLLQYTGSTFKEIEKKFNTTMYMFLEKFLKCSEFSINKLWEVGFRVEHSDIVVYKARTHLNRNPSKKETIEEVVDFHYSQMVTLWGNCTVMELNDTLKYEGAFTYLKLLSAAGNITQRSFMVMVTKIFENMYSNTAETNNCEEVLEIAGKVADQWVANPTYLSGNYYYAHHHSKYISKNNMFYFSTKVNDHYYTTGLITVKKIQLLNTSQNPCYAEDDVVNCWNDCIDNKLASNVNCRMPFMSLIVNKSECLSGRDFLDAFKTTLDYFRNMNTAECDCSHRICNRTIYDVSYSLHKKIKKKMTHLTLMFTNMLEKSEEVYLYGIRNLLSDIGGSLSVFLGISVLTVIELVEIIYHIVCSCHKKVIPKSIFTK